MIEIRIGDKLLRWLAGDCRKVKYGHKETAEKAADSMHKKTGDEYDVYHCGGCNAWHIGHAR